MQKLLQKIDCHGRLVKNTHILWTGRSGTEAYTLKPCSAVSECKMRKQEKGDGEWKTVFNMRSMSAVGKMNSSTQSSGSSEYCSLHASRKTPSSGRICKKAIQMLHSLKTLQDVTSQLFQSYFLNTYKWL